MNNARSLLVLKCVSISAIVSILIQVKGLATHGAHRVWANTK